MIRLVILICVVAILPAAELIVRDLRLGAETRPSDFHYDYSSPLASGSGNDGFDTGLGIEGGGRWSFTRPGDSVGVVLGADLALDGQTYKSSDGLATVWARVSAGVGWAPADRWTLILEGGAMYGLSTIRLPATAATPAFDADGTATGYDARFVADYLLSRRVGIGLVAGWLVANHDLKKDDSHLKLDQSGWFGGLEIIWRFSDAPTRLE